MEERTSDFLKSFENVSSWVKCENSDSQSIPLKDMGPCIENIHKNMTALKEVNFRRLVTNSRILCVYL